MGAIVEKIRRLADSVSLFAANVAALVLVALVILTCVDVVGRYFFSAPVTGAVELVRICMAGIIFFTFPLTFLRGDHIIVDLIPAFRKGYLGWLVSLLFLFVMLAVIWIIADRVYDYAWRAYEDGDTTEYLFIYRFWIVGFITISLFVTAFMTGLRILTTLMHPGEVDTSAETGDTQ